MIKKSLLFCILVISFTFCSCSNLFNKEDIPHYLKFDEPQIVTAVGLDKCFYVEISQGSKEFCGVRLFYGKSEDSLDYMDLPYKSGTSSCLIDVDSNGEYIIKATLLLTRSGNVSEGVQYGVILSEDTKKGAVVYSDKSYDLITTVIKEGVDTAKQAVGIVINEPDENNEVSIIGLKCNHTEGLVEWCTGDAMTYNLECKPLNYRTTQNNHTLGCDPVYQDSDKFDNPEAYIKSFRTTAGYDYVNYNPEDKGYPGKYPAWNSAHIYGTENNLKGDFAKDWYLPTYYEIANVDEYDTTYEMKDGKKEYKGYPGKISIVYKKAAGVNFPAGTGQYVLTCNTAPLEKATQCAYYHAGSSPIIKDKANPDVIPYLLVAHRVKLL